MQSRDFFSRKGRVRFFDKLWRFPLSGALRSFDSHPLLDQDGAAPAGVNVRFSRHVVRGNGARLHTPGGPRPAFQNVPFSPRKKRKKNIAFLAFTAESARNRGHRIGPFWPSCPARRRQSPKAPCPGNWRSGSFSIRGPEPDRKFAGKDAAKGRGPWIRPNQIPRSGQLSVESPSGEKGNEGPG